MRCRKQTRQVLVEMMVRVDHSGHQHMAVKIDDSIRRIRQFCSRTDGLNDAIADEQAAIGDFSPLVIHTRNHFSVS